MERRIAEIEDRNGSDDVVTAMKRIETPRPPIAAVVVLTPRAELTWDRWFALYAPHYIREIA